MFYCVLKNTKSHFFFLDKAALLDRSNPDLFIVKTDVLLALDRTEEASSILNEAFENFEGEERVNLLFELADLYDEYENFDIVFDCLRMILKTDAENEEALYKICFWTDYTGRNEEGIKLHQSILDANPFSELAWFNLGAAYQGKIGRAHV